MIVSALRIPFVLFLFLFSHVPLFASSFKLEAVPVSQVVSLYFSEVHPSPFVLCDELLKDSRLVSVRSDGAPLSSVIPALLADYGYSITKRPSHSFVCKAVSLPAPIASESIERFVYRPLHRDSGYLTDFLSSYFPKGKFLNSRPSRSGTAVKVEGANPSPALNTASDDLLIFSGPPGEVSALRELLSVVDLPIPEVQLRAFVVEVSLTESDASAFEVIASLLSSRLSIDLRSPVKGDTISLSVGGLQVVHKVLNEDARIRTVAAPSFRVRSGGSTRFQVGNDVPVLSSTSTSQAGQVVQAVEYRSSGTILQFSPVVRGNRVFVDVSHEVSGFVQTETGVNTTPTLQKRSFTTSLTLEPGSAVLLGGLASESTQGTDKSLPWFSVSRSSSVKRSDLVVIVEASIH
jgi:general secretion pathway protein D